MSAPSTPRSVALAVAAACAASLAGCDALMTDPAEPSPELTVSFQITQLQPGGTAEAFARVNRLFLSFVRADQFTRDTLLFVRPLDGRLRAGVSLTTDERIAALGIQAELRFGPLPLFVGGGIVPIDPGVPTVAHIQLQPVPASVLASQQTLAMILPQSTQLSSAVLYATADTIEGLAGAWTSSNANVVAVSPGGLAVTQGRGSAELYVVFAGLVDTVLVTVQ